MEDPSIGRVIENINKYTNQKEVSMTMNGPVGYNG
jgi:hypothetical protein